MLSKTFKLMFKHKFITGIILVLVITGGYFSYTKIFSNDGIARYATTQVQKGTLITSISGNGQIDVFDQIDLKPEVSGDLIYVNIKTGQKVNKGQVLAYIDPKDAERTVRDAQINFESAQISLEKLINNQQSNMDTAVNNLNQSYRDAYNKVSDAFLNLPSFMELSRSILYDDSGISSVCSDNLCAYSNLTDVGFRQEFKIIVDRAKKDYEMAKDAYDPNFQNYRNIRLDASAEEIITILKETKNTVELLAQAIKSEQNMLDSLVSDIKESATKQSRKAQIDQKITNYQSDIGTTLSKLNGIVSNLENADKSIESIKKSIENYQLANPVDVKSQENTVLQKETALQDAKENLGNYVIKAPFSGLIAESDVKQGDSVSQNTIIATLFTEQSIARISLNEIDIAKVKLNQPVTLTFDIMDGLTLTGKVTDIASIASTNQGLVTYDIIITLDTMDELIKPGMSVTAAIIIDAKPDVLLVPNSAVKSQDGISYVEIPNESDMSVATANVSGAVFENPTRQQQVEIGLSNDEFTEILSGLQEGAMIITRIIQPTVVQSAQTQQNSSVQLPGLNTGGTGGTRMMR